MKKSKISIFLYIIIFLLVIMLSIYIITFSVVFWGREIPSSLSKWSSYASIFSSMISLSNLVLVTFLTTKAHDFQRHFSSRQIEVDRIKVITDYRMKKLYEIESYVNSLNDIVKIPFNDKKSWKEQLTILRRSIVLFDKSGASIFALPEYQNLKTIEKKCNKIVDLINESDLLPTNLDKEMQELNILMVDIRNKLWEYTYTELKKDMEA